MKNHLFKLSIHFFTCLALCLLCTLIIFLLTEAQQFFQQTSLSDFLFNADWDIGSEPFSFGILNILLANVLVAALACVISFFFALGISLFICFYAGKPYQFLLIHSIKILAGIPSIIYGFFALFVIVRTLEHLLSLSSGESLLAGSLVLSVMILPFFTSHMVETMQLIKQRFAKDSQALGVSIGFFIRKVVLKNVVLASFAGFVLAFSRAVGETMAVMMVIGNTPLFPTLLSKVQTIPALIALEMGTSEVNSPHYYALIASGCVLLSLVLGLNILLFILEKKNAKH